jgi:riboflavin synthase alpha subunit
MITVSTIDASARAGSRVKIEVAVSKLYPLKGHVVIGTPVSLSLKEN